MEDRRTIFLRFRRNEYSRILAWLKVRKSGPHAVVVEGHGYVVSVPEHWWRKRHDEDCWGFYAAFAVHSEGPDTMTRYDGVEERGFILDEPPIRKDTE